MTMFCDCGNPEAHRGEHIPKPVTDTPLDPDAIRVRDGHLNATEDVRFLLAEVERLTYVNAEHRRRDESQDAIRQQLTTRAEKAEAQVAAVLAECRKVATVSGNASGYPYVLVNTIVGAIERAS